MLVTAAVVGLSAWKLVPLIPGFAELDRSVFEFSIRSFANPPFFVSGNGSHEQPWTLRTISADSTGNRKEAPTVISIGDDPDGVFQNSPPSAVDYAVILRNLNRLGVRRVAIPAVMAWDESDPIALTAVDARLADFESSVTAAPLTRGASSENLPLPFFLASIPLDRVKGDVGNLPQVNRLSFPGTFLGSGKTLAGFSLIESEPASRALLARWKDRIVFSFPVVAALAESGQKADQIEVRLGSYMKLGPGGPVVPIDAAGHLASAPVRFVGKSIPAQTVIDAGELKANGTVVIRDDRTNAEPEIRTFSESVVGTFASIRDETGLTKPKEFRRLDDAGESSLILGLSLALAVLSSTSVFRLRLIAFGVAALILIAQLSGLAWGSLWLPLYPSLCTMAAGYLGSLPIGFSRPVKAVAAETAEPKEVEGFAEAGEPAQDSSSEGPSENENFPEPTLATSAEEPPAEASPVRKPRAVPAKKTAKKAAKKAAPTKGEPTQGEPLPEKAVKKVAKKAAPAKKAAKKAAAAKKAPAKKAPAKKAAKKTPKSRDPE